MSKVARGRIIVLLIIIASLALELYNLISLKLSTGLVDPKTVVRLILTALLLLFLYLGANWARLLLGILSLIAGLASLVLIGLVDVKLVSILPMLPQAIYLLTIGIVLLASDSVKAFMRYQRGERTMEERFSHLL